MDLERRHIRLAGSSNFRDIGGYPAADGMKIKWGRVYRSGSLWGLTAFDWEWVERQQISVLCDLRSDAEREVAPTPWRAPTQPRQVGKVYDGAMLFERRKAQKAAGIGAIESDLYVQFAHILAPSFRGFFEALRDGDAPAVIHCTAGQDRTGLAIGLLLGVLGVDRAIIHADYLLSTDLRVPENELDRTKLTELADSNVLAAYYSTLIARHGPSIFQPKRLVDAEGNPLIEIAIAGIVNHWGSVSRYMEAELGMGPAQIAKLREQMLEPV